MGKSAALAPVVVLVACVACSPYSSAPTPDAGPVVDADAGTDAPVDAPVDAGPFCASSSATLCRDFDSVSTVEEGWTKAVVMGGGQVDRDMTLFKSAPASFHSVVPANASTSDAFLQRLFLSPTFGVATLEMDVFVKTPAWTSAYENVALVTILFHEQSTGRDFDANIFVLRSSLQVTVHLPNFYSADTTSPLPLDRWAHVIFRLELPTTANPAMQVVINEELAVDRAFPASAMGSVDELRLNVGVQSPNPPAPAFDVHYDNVTFTGQ